VTPAMRPKLWIKVAVTLAFLGLIFWVVPFRQLWGAARRLEPAVWLSAFAGLVAGHGVGVFKWRLNVNLSRANLRPLDAVQCYSAGMFANLCLPTIVGGDALKALLAGRVTRRYEAAVIGGVTERLIDTTALLVLITTGAFLMRAAAPGWARQVALVGALIAIATAVLFLPLLLRQPLARWPKRLRPTAGRSLVALRRLRRRPQLALGVLAISLSIQAWFVLLNAWLGRGIGIEIPLAVWFFAVPMAKAVTLLPISVGGFGLREVTIAGWLTLLAAVPNEEGLAASFLWQTLVIAIGLSGGAAWFALGLRRGARTGAGHGSLLAPLAAGAQNARATGRP